jgi:hypothetical protein
MTLETILLKCPSCQKKVAQLTRAYESEQEWRIKAICPYCGDETFEKELKGMFSYAGYHEQKDEEEVIKFTDLDDVEYDGNLITIKLKKA